MSGKKWSLVQAAIVSLPLCLGSVALAQDATSGDKGSVDTSDKSGIDSKGTTTTPPPADTQGGDKGALPESSGSSAGKGAMGHDDEPMGTPGGKMDSSSSGGNTSPDVNGNTSPK